MDSYINKLYVFLESLNVPRRNDQTYRGGKHVTCKTCNRTHCGFKLSC